MTSRAARSSLAFTALALAGLIWGASFVLGKIALRELSVPHLMLYRFGFASAGFAPLLLRSRPRLPPRDWAIIAVVGLVGVPVQFLAQFEGLARTTASHAALMIGAAPVLAAAAAYVALRERLSRLVWVALAVSTIGVVCVILGVDDGGVGSAAGPTLAGDLLVFASMFAAVVWILASKRLMTRYSAVVVSGLITVAGTILLALWVLVRDGLPPVSLGQSTWLAILALGLVATTCATVFWNWGLSHTDVGKAGAFINLEPVVGAVLGVVVLHETLGPMAVIGGVLIIAGAMVVSWLGV